jgi:hypothetical protein
LDYDPRASAENPKEFRLSKIYMNYFIWRETIHMLIAKKANRKPFADALD